MIDLNTFYGWNMLGLLSEISQIIWNNPCWLNTSPSIAGFLVRDSLRSSTMDLWMSSGDGILEVFKMILVWIVLNSLTSMMMSSRLLSKLFSILLSIVTKCILEGESCFITIWLQYGIMKFIVLVSFSWDVLRGIDCIWINGTNLILFFSSVKSLGWIIKIKPVRTLWCFFVHRITTFSLSWLVIVSSLLRVSKMLSGLMMMTSVVMVVSFEFYSRDVLNETKSCEGHNCFHHF